MNSTKRKFNNLLQGLSRSSSDRQNADATTSRPPGTPQKTSDVETFLDKRRRLGLPLSNSPVQSNPPTPGKAGSPSSTVGTSPRRTESKREPEKPLAKYCPGDRSELLRRLATFQELTDWTFKPDRVSEIEWAKRGWICKGKETVRCVLCHKELVVKLNRKNVEGKEVPVLVSSDIEEGLIEKYEELIVSAHFDDCLWRKRGSESSLLRLPLSSTTSALEELRVRYDELRSRESFLPYEFNIRLPEGLDLGDVLASLPPDFFKNSQQASIKTPNRPALTLALLGWQGLSNSRIGPVPNSASCQTCLRRLGLWMFKSKEVDEDGEVLVPAPMDHLDPVREHRFFCPWKNQDTQRRSNAKASEGEALPGWRILLQTIKNESNLRDLYAGRSKSRPKSIHAPSNPSTPVRRSHANPVTPVAGDASAANDSPHVASQLDAEEYDEKVQDEEDKARWARLKKVKTLFDIKGARKRMSISRPGTSHSTATTGDGK
ncbi:unnamed protein product [Clonostachys chloroleuca]|uniref:mRNA export factor rsm1 n=1 Tax=Clonostachys chloroleuca TaxID=1926264 RepID=A0AA35Q3M3_9HYPO|nr:unnamed protein product [Clonostachys chloroleuca]